MSLTSAYRLALYLLPARLRRKHGRAMETLFARELRRARAEGWLPGALAGAAGVWDVARRGAYERLRPVWYAAEERGGGQSGERRPADTHGPQQTAAHLGAPHGGRPMPLPTAWQLLRRHVTSFATALVVLTASVLAIYASKQATSLSAVGARGATVGTMAELLLLAVPFTVALTIPMAVFVAVLWEFTRLRADGSLAAARPRRDGVHRLVVPVLAAAVAVAALTLGSNTTLLPRANARLASVIEGRPVSIRSDREMTVGELRAAARRARADAGPHARAAAAEYEVEVQKKYALAAACVVLALAGMAVSLRVPHGPRGGAGLVIGASGVVFGAYYAMIVTGEQLAEQLVVSPFVGMWGANALVLAVALLALWRAAPVAPVERRAVVIRG